jgi:transposase
MSKSAQPQTISVSEISALIKKAEDGQLSATDGPLVINSLRMLLMTIGILEDHKASLAKLRKIVFGPKSEKRRHNQNQQNPSSVNNQPNSETAKANAEAAPVNSASTLSENPVSQDQQEKPQPEREKKPGHGHLGVKDFPGAKVSICLHQELRPNDKCPHPHCGGKLSDTDEPSTLIKREARPIIDAIKFERQVLRCSRCRDRFTASLPKNVSEEKFDITADVMIAIVHYSHALPFYRLAQMQMNLGCPLPASTQFDRAEIVANAAHPVFLELNRVAAKCGLIHGDDTTVRILSLIKENKLLSDDERKGMFTTGIGARTPEFDIVLYCSGRQYCGENLDKLMIKRPSDLTEPIVMGDAANKNWSKKFKKLIAKCLAHARRNFVDCETAFRTECGEVLDMLGEVYKIDAQTKGMTPQERLAYHQQHSQPIMDKLHLYINNLITVGKKEPNSALGKAIGYMNNHWEHLTQFLKIAGCPLDNNFIERCLRKAVILRKNSLFFKTEHGAQIGDVLQSILGTCNVNHINPFEYLTALMKNKKDVRKHPELWLPWNYQLQLQKSAS